jgi:hypothetical protein
MKQLIIILCTVCFLTSHAQNKMGNTWLVGVNGNYAQFDGSTARPKVGRYFADNASNYPYNHVGGHSCISDCVSGDLLLSCNGNNIYDAYGNIIDNGSNLLPPAILGVGGLRYTQSTLILPKGTNGEYYVFISTVTDTTFLNYWGGGNTPNKTPNDLLLYNVVDMKANNGAGKVISKSMPLITGTHLSQVCMQACKHANGKDWWLLKQGLNDNIIYRFLVTANGITGPTIQSFSEPKFGYTSNNGQCAFSKDGNKYAVVQFPSNELFIADFNRNTGVLSNSKVVNVPIGSTGYPNLDSSGQVDDIIMGVCFSPNGQFLYISKYFNIYQYELGITDSSLAWVRIQHGSDTLPNKFEFYKHMYVGADNRIYVGKHGGSYKDISVIDFPNNKGSACGFCRKCLRIDSAWGGLTTPPNMPDYNLGFTSCYPLGIDENESLPKTLLVYPNPAKDIIIVEQIFGESVSIVNIIGQVLQTQVVKNNKAQFSVANLPRGIYTLKSETQVSKVLVE